MRAGLNAVLAALAAGASTMAAAQEPAALRADRIDALPVGTVVERVVSAVDTSQSWAAYLPTGYTAERSWPILFVMDPRGRALLPLERLVRPAERYGWVVMSSYNTASDYTGPDPNEPALAAMLFDAQTLVALDPRRLYLMGFSGTARRAWALGMRLTGNIAGIIGVGGGMPPPMYDADLNPLREHPEFGFYGLVGTRDFNHDEMWRLEELLDANDVANDLAFFDGPHAWAPADLLARALGWMELRAMRTGLRPVDPALVDSLHRARTSRARALEEADDPVAAWREYDAVADDFRGLTDVGRARRHAERLAETSAVEEGLQRRAELRHRFWTVVAELEGLLLEVRMGVREPDPEAIAEDLGLDALLEQAADSADPVAARAATRVLEHVYVNTSFYQPRSYIELGRTEHALAMLEVAGRIFPDRPRVCLFRARALAAARRTDEALEAARCALDAGLPPDLLESDPGLESLRVLPAFRELVRGVGSGRA